MALPTQKHTKSRNRKRRAALKLKKIRYTVCPKCKKPVLPHHVCGFCGTYAGKEILKVKFASEKKKKPGEDKMKEK